MKDYGEIEDLRELPAPPITMTVAMGERSLYVCLRDVKVLPSSFKWLSMIIIIVGLVIFFAALMMQEGTLRTYSSDWEPWMSSSSGDTACLSRAHHMLYRPTSQIIPSSPALVSALTAYEKRHAECSRSLGKNWTETFHRSWDPPAGSNDIDNLSGCQFLVYLESVEGLGNRIMALVSAFLYALLTNRVLLINSTYEKGHLANLLCEPFSWMLPPDFPMNLLYAAPDLGEAINREFKNMNVLQLKLEHVQSWGDQRLFCAETRECIKNITWVSWKSNQYYVPRFFTFPDFWPKLTTLFPNPSHVFTHLSRYLILPNNELWEKIFRIHSSYLSSAGQLVGIQIRRHYASNSGDYSGDGFTRILHCLTAHHILPSISSAATDLSSERMLELMDKRSPGSRRTGKNEQQLKYAPNVTSVLISSLQHQYAEELQVLYSNYPTVDGSLVRVHMVTHDGMEWHTYDQAQKALVEMWLLSLSDYLATSSYSTFGYVAQGLGALRPFIVNLQGHLALDVQHHMHDESIPHSHCVVGQTPDPCNHYPFWPKTDCGNESARTSAHKEWLEKHLRNCQDLLAGTQLVP